MYLQKYQYPTDLSLSFMYLQYPTVGHFGTQKSGKGVLIALLEKLSLNEFYYVVGVNRIFFNSLSALADNMPLNSEFVNVSGHFLPVLQCMCKKGFTLLILLSVLWWKHCSIFCFDLYTKFQSVDIWNSCSDYHHNSQPENNKRHCNSVCFILNQKGLELSQNALGGSSSTRSHR